MSHNSQLQENNMSDIVESLSYLGIDEINLHILLVPNTDDKDEVVLHPPKVLQYHEPQHIKAGQCVC